MTIKFPRVAVVGSRDFPSKAMVERFVYLLPKDWTIVSGGARGVDAWAEGTAKCWGRHTDIYEPNWAKHGKAAGYIRNNYIVRNADVVVAFHHDNSRGTKHTIQLAKYLNKPCVIVRLQNAETVPL